MTVPSVHTTSRRDFLGHVAGAGTWSNAMKHYEAACAAETAYDQKVWTPALHAYGSGGLKVPAQIDAEIERLGDARYDAREELIATPAPNLSVVIWKIEWSRKQWEDAEDWPEHWWAAVMSDLRRLSRSQLS